MNEEYLLYSEDYWPYYHTDNVDKILIDLISQKYNIPKEAVCLEFLDVFNIIPKNGQKFKYPLNNWQQVDGHSISEKDNAASIFRHHAKRTAGLLKDEESGYHHDLHVAIRALMRYYRDIHGIKHIDDK